MPAIATTTTNRKARGLGQVINNKEKPKKKLSYYQKKKAIEEIADSINAGMTRRYLFDMLFRKEQ
jgi:hypothetical protein